VMEWGHFSPLSSASPRSFPYSRPSTSMLASWLFHYNEEELENDWI
jgi:hypothetical protein